MGTIDSHIRRGGLPDCSSFVLLLSADDTEPRSLGLGEQFGGDSVVAAAILDRLLDRVCDRHQHHGALVAVLATT